MNGEYWLRRLVWSRATWLSTGGDTFGFGTTGVGGPNWNVIVG